MTPSIVIITGLSGSGLSTALKALEDIGFRCIDNLPTRFIEPMVDMAVKESGDVRYAIVMPVASAEAADGLAGAVRAARQNIAVEVVYLLAESEVIADRYGTTRRRHPLTDEAHSLDEAIAAQICLQEPLRDLADVVIDTSTWSVHHLARVVAQRYADRGHHRALHVSLTSFGFKHGLHRPLDTLFDVRFLPNPYFVPELASGTGLDRPVAEYVLQAPLTQEFLSRITDLLVFLLPNYFSEGKHYLRVGFGCTGGQHRSVAICEAVGQALKTHAELDFLTVNTFHRDIVHSELQL